MAVAAEAEAKVAVAEEEDETHAPNPSLAPNRDPRAVPSPDPDEQPRFFRIQSNSDKRNIRI